VGYVAVAALLLGFGKAGVAGTLGPFVTILLVIAFPADDALGLALPMLIFADAFSVAAYWRKWDASLLPALLVPALAGLALGTFVLFNINELWLRRLIAVSMLVFVAVYLGGRFGGLTPQARRPAAIAAGSSAGFMSAVANAGGPPIIMYLMAAQLEPRRFVATSIAFFAIVNLIKVPGYLVADLFDIELIRSTLWAWLLIPVGVGLGRLLIDHIDRRKFEYLTLALLTAGAVVLLVR
jgi:uncharacterized membrane protein YfcA